MCDWQIIIVLAIMSWLVLAIALALMEYDERKRQRKWKPKGRYDDWP
jgi:hypothetical protein